jgi:hypothetical protein
MFLSIKFPQTSYLDGLDEEDGGLVGVVVEDWPIKQPPTNALDGGCLRNIDDEHEIEDEKNDLESIQTNRCPWVSGREDSFMSPERSIESWFWSPAAIWFGLFRCRFLLLLTGAMRGGRNDMQFDLANRCLASIRTSSPLKSVRIDDPKMSRKLFDSL